MKVVFITPFYKRLDLTEMCFSELKKQRRTMYAVGSEGNDSKELAEKYGVKYLEYPNNPVSDKHNALTGMLKDIEFDYAVLIGSDNFVSSNFTKELVKFLKAEKPDYTQFTGVYFYHQKDKVTTYYEGFTGVGRCYSKQVLEALNYNLWENGLNFGLDGSSQKTLQSKGYKPTMIDMKQMGIEVLDVKYADSITPHEVVYKGEKVDSISIDVTMFDGLENYNTIVHRVNPKKVNTAIKGKIKVVEIATGLKKFLPKWVADDLIKKQTYKLAK
jgi:hypothetical protein